jgi:hypothetical protein
MAATNSSTPPRPSTMRRLAAVLALATVLLLGAMSTAALAAPKNVPARPASHQAATPAAQPISISPPTAAILPLVLGGIVFLALLMPVSPYQYRRSSH